MEFKITIGKNKTVQQEPEKPSAKISIERFGNSIKVTVDGQHNELVEMMYHAVGNNQALEHILNHAAEIAFKKTLEDVQKGIPVKPEVDLSKVKGKKVD